MLERLDWRKSLLELSVLEASPDILILNVAEVFCNCVTVNHAIVYKTGTCLTWKTMTVPFLNFSSQLLMKVPKTRLWARAALL